MLRARDFGLASFAVVVTFGVTCPAGAETLSTSGTFLGVYRQDRWGVGHFGHFIVVPELHERLKQHEDKRIKIQVKRAEQRSSAGPACLYEIERLTRVPEQPRELDIEMITRPAGLRANRPFQLVCYLHNRGKTTIHVESSYVVIHLYSRRAMDGTEKPSFSCKGYTRGQLMLRDRITQMGQCLVKYAWGGYTNLGR